MEKKLDKEALYKLERLEQLLSEIKQEINELKGNNETKTVKEKKNFKSFSTHIAENYYEKIKLLAEEKGTTVSNYLKQYIDDNDLKLVNLCMSERIRKENAKASHYKKTHLVSIGVDDEFASFLNEVVEKSGETMYVILRNAIYDIVINNENRLRNLIADRYYNNHNQDLKIDIRHDEDHIYLGAALPDSYLNKVHSADLGVYVKDWAIFETFKSYKDTYIKPLTKEHIMFTSKKPNWVDFGHIAKREWGLFEKVCYFYNMDPAEAIENYLLNLYINPNGGRGW